MSMFIGELRFAVPTKLCQIAKGEVFYFFVFCLHFYMIWLHVSTAALKCKMEVSYGFSCA